MNKKVVIFLLLSIFGIYFSGCEDKKDMAKDIIVTPAKIKIKSDCTNYLLKYHDAYIHENKKEAEKYLLEHDKCVDMHISITK